MSFGIIILIRVLFVASMIFIIGYIFGGFSKNPTLKTIARIASILVIILFITSNIFLTRFGGWHHGYYQGRNECRYDHADSTIHR